ncbi:hypothetical protein I3842_16G028100 [Carya illinoinensis]|uniref:Uncharacterized protein n=1 Tax=Carya illinoinensis TaxID=32201 RepID=A0A922A3Z4_CARIL|nr:hypothetical protein I3842_16G028100 [Carya illinoinensis]
MVPRGPGMNRYLNRENPNTLVEIIADQQIIGPGEDKGDQRRGEGSEGMGPLKTAAEISGTAAPKINAFLSLSLSLSLSLCFCSSGYIRSLCTPFLFVST